jgi:hypothetical protein
MNLVASIFFGTLVPIALELLTPIHIRTFAKILGFETKTNYIADTLRSRTKLARTGIAIIIVTPLIYFALNGNSIFVIATPLLLFMYFAYINIVEIKLLMNTTR